MRLQNVTQRVLSNPIKKIAVNMSEADGIFVCVSMRQLSSERRLSGFGRPCHAHAPWGRGGVGRERTHVTLKENWRLPRSRPNPTLDLSLDAETV